MAITISGENNNDRILASDGVIDSLSGFNVVGVITATSFTGDVTGDVTGNLIGNVTGNINNSTLLLQTGGNERVRIESGGDVDIKGGVIKLASGANRRLMYRSGNNDIVLEGAANFFYRQVISDTSHRWYTNGADEKLTITGAGNIGIGTNNPQCLLDMSKDISGGVNYVDIRNHHATGGAALRVKTQGTYGSPTYQAILGASDAGGTIRVGAVSNHPLLLLVNNQEKLQIATDGVITAQKSASFGNTSDSFTAVQITSSTSGISELRFADTTANPGYLKYTHSNDVLEFVAGTNNQLYLYGSSKEARFSGYVVAQTSGSGTSSATASFGATQSGMDANSYNYILSGSNDQGNKCVMFVNGSSRSTDGGTNTLTFRNDGGNLRLGNSGTNTNILGNLTFEQPIIQQQTKFQYTNSGGVGAYLSLFNPSATAGSKTGISFGIGNSNAQLDGGDWGEGQIKVYTDSGLYGNMEFNLHTGANRSYMKIVGNGQRESGAGAGTEGMTGGVAFGNAGIAIDRSWTGQPGIHVFNENNVGDTDQGTFRFHGWNRSYASYPGSSGGDFGVVLVADGMTLTSDRRRKTDITTITGALDTVSQMRGVSFTYVNRDLEPQTHMSMDNGKKLGFIAQEVIPLLPELILDSGEKAVELENGYCDRYNMDYGGVTPLLVEAIKELKTKNEALEARIAALEGS